MAKNYLVILKNSSHDLTISLDLALGLAALEQQVTILFLGTAVVQLLAPEQLKILKALALYDINNVYVAQTSLEQMNLAQKKLAISAKIADNKTVNNLFNNSDVIL